jgi:hypothetical protein
LFRFCILLFAFVGSCLALAIHFYLSLLPLVGLLLFAFISCLALVICFFHFYLLFGSHYLLLSFAFSFRLAFTFHFWLFSWFLFLIFVSHFRLLFIASISFPTSYMAFTFHPYFFANLHYLWLCFRSWFYLDLSFNSWFNFNYLLHILKYLSTLVLAFRFCFLIHVSNFCLHSSLHYMYCFYKLVLPPLLFFLQVWNSKANSRWRSSFQALFDIYLKSTFTFSNFFIYFDQQNYNKYLYCKFIFSCVFFLCLFFKAGLGWFNIVH